VGDRPNHYTAAAAAAAAATAPVKQHCTVNHLNFVLS
jgi:hypothetical protein